MNRIILIGNGFDLAHKLATSYKNFLDDYWNNIITELKTKGLSKHFENNEITIDSFSGHQITTNDCSYEGLNKLITKAGRKIVFKNKFLEIISNKSNINNWVDVESEYYELLKKSYTERIDRYNIRELNSDFTKIKVLLKKYLKKTQENYKQNSILTKGIGDKIYQPFKFKDFPEKIITRKAEQEYNLLKQDIKFIEEDSVFKKHITLHNKRIIDKIDITNPIESIKCILLSNKASKFFNFIPSTTLLLSFNYTSLEKNYINSKEFDYYYNKPKKNNQFEEVFTNTETLHIHGTIDNKDSNPIIFGYGDELDKEYKKIENLDNNNYLENIKSINYLETNNYKKLLSYIDSDIFQVFIFGHSCGLSDRTLLNTIFEHDNCGSIKVFYHQKDTENDNFSDIVRNISRNFNSKVKMRDRVVNKNYCEPLVEFEVSSKTQKKQ